jgi:hypothetical protein
MTYQYHPMTVPSTYPAPHLREYRKKWHEAGYQPEGYWLECYSPLLGRWNTIRYLGAI